MDIAILDPYYGLLLLLLPLLWRFSRRTTRIWHKVLRTLLFSSVIVALMQPVLLYQADQLQQVIIVDQSDSMSTEAKALARDTASQLLQQDTTVRSSLILLGGEPLATEAPQLVIEPEFSRSSLTQALQQALQTITAGSDSVINLITDGRATDRHWQPLLTELRQRNIVLNTFYIDSPLQHSFIDNVQVLPVRQGEMATVLITAELAQQTGLQFSLYSEDEQLATTELFYGSGRVQSELTFIAPDSRFMPLTVVLTENGHPVNSFDTVAAIQPALPLLYLGQRQQGAASQLQKLLGNGFDVTVADPDSTIDISGYPLIFIDDLPAQKLSTALQQQLQAAVRDHGTGLMVSGGEAAFGHGGYAASVLSDMLPVQLAQDEQVQSATVALAIIIDTSGSMIGEPLELAKQIARFAVRKLKPSDYVGIVEFYGARHWSVPMQPATQTDDIERAIGRMQARGASELFPAIQEGYYGLKNTNTRFKHMLLITDAGVEEENYQRLLRHIAQDNINVSTILTGQVREGEERMAELASWGRGRFYTVPDEFSLVELNLHQEQPQPEAEYQRGQFSLNASAAQSWWQDINLQTIPALQGYARVRQQVQAETLLATASGDPLLSSWQYGAGRVTALMTEPFGQGTAAWQQWPDYGRWLARIAARTADQQQPFQLTLNRRFDHFQLQALRHSASIQAPQTVLLYAEDNTEMTELELQQKAPGLFVAERAFDRSKPVLIELQYPHGVQRIAERAFADSHAESEAVSDQVLLMELATITGGQAINGADAKPFSLTATSSERVAELRFWLLLLALLLYLTELLYRRWPSRRTWLTQDN